MNYSFNRRAFLLGGASISALAIMTGRTPRAVAIPAASSTVTASAPISFDSTNRLPTAILLSLPQLASPVGGLPTIVTVTLGVRALDPAGLVTRHSLLRPRFSFAETTLTARYPEIQSELSSESSSESSSSSFFLDPSDPYQGVSIFSLALPKDGTARISIDWEGIDQLELFETPHSIFASVSSTEDPAEFLMYQTPELIIPRE